MSSMNGMLLKTPVVLLDSTKWWLFDRGSECCRCRDVRRRRRRYIENKREMQEKRRTDEVYTHGKATALAKTNPIGCKSEGRASEYNLCIDPASGQAGGQQKMQKRD